MPSRNFTTEQIQELVEQADSSLRMLYTSAGTTIIMTGFVLQSALITFLNVLVLLVIFCDSKMRKIPHYLCIGNLAFCDLLVGCFVSPLNIPFILYQEKAWNYGTTVCKAWVVVDNIVGYETALAVSLIVRDRYLSAKHGISYFEKETAPKCILLIFTSWLWCFCIYGPVIILWDIVQGYSNLPEHECDVEFDEIPSAVGVLTALEMLVPSFFLCLYCAKLYSIYKKRCRKYQKLLNLSPVSRNEDYGYGFVAANTDISVKKKRKQIELLQNVFTGVTMYLLFWGPYIFTYFVLAILQDEVNGYLRETVYWFNVGGILVHPFLFAFGSRRFTRKLGKWIATLTTALFRGLRLKKGRRTKELYTRESYKIYFMRRKSIRNETQFY